MRKFRATTNRRQMAILPRSIDEYVPEDDIVRYVDTLVDELDLRSIEDAYSYNGRPAYEPRVLVKILIYGKMRGIRSSRSLSTATRENLRFIFLASNEQPDFRTIINFRKRFHKELGGLFKQTVRIGMEQGFITLEHVCIDGTKIRAFAGRNSFKDPKKLRELLDQVEAEVVKSYEEDIRIDEKEDARHGDDSNDKGLPKELQQREVMVEKIRNAIKEWESIDGRKPEKISITDPESRYMKSKGIVPSYNAQVGVDHDSLMAVGGFVTKCCTDNGQLTGMLEEVEEETGRNPKAISVDKGYGDHKGLAEVEGREIDGYIPKIRDVDGWYSLEDFKYDKGSDSYECPSGRRLRFKHEGKRHRQYKCDDCQGCSLREKCLRKPNGQRNRSLNVSIHVEKISAMRVKMKTERAKEMLKVRGATVEPVIGQLKYCRGLRQFFFRGIEMVNSMWKLELAAYNIGKLARRFMRNELAPCPT